MRGAPTLLLLLLFAVLSVQPARAETGPKERLETRIRVLERQKREAVKRLKQAKKRDEWLELKGDLKELDTAMKAAREALAQLDAPVPPPPPQDGPEFPAFSIEVQGDGGPVGVAKEPTVKLACGRGTIQLSQTAIGRNGYLPATCSAANGTRISQDFEEAALPVFDSCIRKLAVEWGATDVSGPIELSHLGIISSREIARAHLLSLHEAGRAIDIAQVKIAGLHFDYLDDLKTRGQPGSKWEGFWLKFEYCAAHSSREHFFWPIEAVTEAETIVDRDIEPSLEAWVAQAKPDAFPHYKEYQASMDEDGNPTFDLSDDDQKIWDATQTVLQDLSKTLVPYILRATSPTVARKDPEFRKAVLAALKEKLGIDPAPAAAAALFDRALKIGPILHRDHLHFSFPFTRDPGGDYAQG